ncbi:MAG: OmpL47-type beta-barrel domain-containing protein, partial [Anaerolineae bacterium]
FTVTWSSFADLSGIGGAYYKLNAEPIGPTDGTWVTTTNTITNILVPAEGEHAIYLWLKDRAGNVDHQTRNVLLRAFRYDATPPTTTHAVTGTLGSSGWYTSAVSVGLSASDNLAGVQRTEYRIGANPWQSGVLFSISASGIYTVSYRSIDNANNEETAQELPIWIDREAPTTSLAIAGAMGANGWYTSPITVTFVVTDPVSGRDSTLYRLNGGMWQAGESLVVDSDGIHTLEYYSIDRAGNREATHTATLRVDLLPPLTMYATEGTAGDGGWFRSPVTITLTPTDLASGPAATYYRLDAGSWISGTKLTVSSEGTHSLVFYSRDYAGNLEASQGISVNIDVTPPLPPFGLSSQPAGWTKTNAFTVTWSSFADLSGIGGAYYKLNAEPTHPADGTYVAGAANQIVGIQVPEEGKHTIYLWLRDGAGNANHLTRNVLNQALWLDITPPTTTHVLTGSLGLNGWYTSPVQVGLSAVDALSGVDRFFYRILGMTDWNQGQFFTITTSGRHSIQYYAVDAAGNEESTKTGFVRVDLEAPPAPINLRAEQVGWQSENSFSAIWDNPLDTSLIGAVYYKLDAPPAHPGDGTLVPDLLSPRIDGIHVPGEGKHDLYVWLRDNAGNSDHTHYAHVPQAFWYDATPPTTTHTITGTAGFADWYRSPVSITLTAADAGSGVLSTVYRVDGGLWQTGSALMISADGVHTVQFYSIDQAGNSEPLRTLTVKIDTRAPSSAVVGPTDVYQEENVLTVSWSGNDPTPGSGLLGYDVQYRVGRLGTWTNWRTATDEVSGLFAGQRGRLYFFRSRARDRAGNEEAYPAGDGDRMVYIEPVANGRFETRDLTSWTHGGELGRRVESLSAHGGGTSYMAVLGNPELGPCYDNQPPTLPIGSAYISQTVYVPAPPDVVAPKLHFWYRIFTYDVVWSERYQRYYDSFDVEITAGGPAQLLLRDGNYDPLKVGAGKPVVDLGWKEGVIDLSPYAGQTVTLYFRNSNREDHYFNTWTYLDDISITDSVTGYRVRVPLVARALAGTAMGQIPMQTAGGPR